MIPKKAAKNMSALPSCSSDEVNEADVKALRSLQHIVKTEMADRLREILLDSSPLSSQEQIRIENALGAAGAIIVDLCRWLCTAARRGHSGCAEWMLKHAYDITYNFELMAKEAEGDTLEGLRAFARKVPYLPVLYSNATETWKADMADLKTKLEVGAANPFDPRSKKRGKVPDLGTPVNAWIIEMFDDVTRFTAAFRLQWAQAEEKMARGEIVNDPEMVRPMFEKMFVDTYSGTHFSMLQRGLMLRAVNMDPPCKSNVELWITRIFKPLAAASLENPPPSLGVATLRKNLAAEKRHDLVKRRNETDAAYDQRIRVATDKALANCVKTWIRKGVKKLVSE